MKKLTSVFLIISVLMLVLAGCGSTKVETPKEEAPKTETPKTEAPKEETPKEVQKKRVGFSNLAVSDVFCKLRQDSFDAKAKTDSELNVLYTDANNDVNKQLDQIDNFIAQKVDAIILMPVDYSGIVPGVTKANAAGVPVITLGIQAESGKTTFVGSKNYDAGKLQGEFMKEKLPQNAQILYLQGQPGLYHSTERWEGFKAALLDQRPDVKLLASLPGDYDRAKGMAVTEDWVQKFPKFDAIIAANDQMALGALQALKGANRLKGVMISGIDGTADACNAIKADEMSQSIFQNAVGQAEKCYQTLKDILSGKPAPEFVDVPFESITKENVDKYMK